MSQERVDKLAHRLQEVENELQDAKVTIEAQREAIQHQVRQSACQAHVRRARSCEIRLCGGHVCDVRDMLFGMLCEMVGKMVGEICTCACY